MQWIEDLKELYSLGGFPTCEEAIEFCEDGKFKSLAEAWLACPAALWLPWYGEAIGVDLAPLFRSVFGTESPYKPVRWMHFYRPVSPPTPAQIRELWPVPPERA